MKRVFLKTGDGSFTIHLPEWDEQYHSKHGAIVEARHVFIQAGLHNFILKAPQKQVSILEIGFGTGLNALLTSLEAKKNKTLINYVGIEAYPLLLSEVKKLNYSQLLEMDEKEFLSFHQSEWEQSSQINPYFQLTKRRQFFSDIEDRNSFDIIYFDAFGPRSQPDLWTENILLKMFTALKPGGVFVTYCAKGEVRRTLQHLGFTTERLVGPPGKREMLRGTK